MARIQLLLFDFSALNVTIDVHIFVMRIITCEPGHVHANKDNEPGVDSVSVTLLGRWMLCVKISDFS